MYDLRPFIEKVKEILKNHYLGSYGKYAQWIKQNDKGNLNLGAAPYGCAIALNILYTINEMPEDLNERKEIIRVLQSFQNADNGLFENPGNYETHTTGFLSGALNLLDAKPLYKVIGFDEYKSKENIFRFMDEIDWAKNPWLGAHLGAGIYASMLLTESAGDEWEDYYFEWLNENADAQTGLWKKGSLEGAPMFHYLAAAFHYVFNYEYAKRALPYPKELLNTCIKAYYDGECIDFSKEIGWADIDFTYMLARVQRRAGIKFEETQKILMEIADGLISQLLTDDISERFDDTNTLFAVVSALAVLQDALPGYIKTSKPMRLVLDRRPFI